MTQANLPTEVKFFSPNYQIGVLEQIKDNVQNISAHILNTALILTYLDDNGSNVPPSSNWEVIQTTQRIVFLATSAFAIAQSLNSPIKISHRLLTVSVPAKLVLLTIVVTSFAVLLIFKYNRWPQHTESFCRKLTKTHQEPAIGHVETVKNIKRLIKDQTALILLEGDFGVGKSTIARDALSSFSHIENVSGEKLPVLSFELAPISLKTSDSYNHMRILSNMIKRWAATPNIHYVLYIDEFSSIITGEQNSSLIIDQLHEIKKIDGARNITIMGSIKTKEKGDINNTINSLTTQCINIKKTTDKHQITNIILRKLILSQVHDPIVVYSKDIIKQILNDMGKKEQSDNSSENTASISIRAIIKEVKNQLRQRQEKTKKLDLKRYIKSHNARKEQWKKIEIELGKTNPNQDTINKLVQYIEQTLSSHQID
jgi:hypothetical protein